MCININSYNKLVFNFTEHYVWPTLMPLLVYSFLLYYTNRKHFDLTHIEYSVISYNSWCAKFSTKIIRPEFWSASPQIITGNMLISNFNFFLQVAWVRAEDQTILSLHTKVVTHNNRISVAHDSLNTWQLRIKQVKESDRGCYMCQINTSIMKIQQICIDVHGE